MRLVTFSVFSCFLVAILSMAMWPENSRFGSPERSFAKVQDQRSPKPAPVAVAVSQDSSQANAAEEALKVKLSFDLDEQPFFDVIEQLGKKTGLNFVLTSSAMDDSLVEEQPITFQLNTVPLNKGLALMLEAHNAAYVIDGGVVKIISLDDALDPKWHRIKMFDCRELLDLLPATSPVAPKNGGLESSAKEAGVGGVKEPGDGGNRSGGGMFSVPPMNPKLSTPQSASAVPAKKPVEDDSQLLEQKLSQLVAVVQAQAEKSQPKPSSGHTLLDLVTTMISPDSWAQAMGTGEVRLVNGILVVSQTESTLLKLDGFLADLKTNLLSVDGTD